MIHDDKDDQEDISAINKDSWNSETYAAWISRFGQPGGIAKKIIADPMKMLSSLKDQFTDVHGKKILNIMGSNGIKAVALAVLGASVTIVDFSGENKRYALKVAESANATITYIQSDILKIKECTQNTRFDIAFAEMGILHYFIDLRPFMSVIFDVLENGGKFIIKDFHPISTKLITYRGTTAKVRKYKVTGDYFDSTIEKVEAAFSKHLQGNDDSHYVYIRKWTLGEIVTAVAKAGLIIESLKEEPNQSSEVFDKGIPKTFTIISKRP
ncbi:MAG: class I SAM-dependent methyltransferase [Spirochaetales bacterium]